MSEDFYKLNPDQLSRADFYSRVEDIVMRLHAEKKALEASAIQSNAEVLELMKRNEELRKANTKFKEILEYIRDKADIGDYYPCMPIPWKFPIDGVKDFQIPLEPGWPEYACSLAWFINHILLPGEGGE